MAPRVDRPVVRVFPARWSSLTDPQGSGRDRSATWKETPKSFDHLNRWFLSLFKGQGARAGRPKRRQDGSPPAPGGRLAQLVRALP